MNLDKLKAKIVEANPEIMEVKEGCEIQVAGDSSTCIFLRSEGGDIRVLYGGWESIVIPRPSYMKVIGRPIRLADVLLAMGKTKLHLTDVRIEFDGSIFKLNPINGCYYKQCQWNLKDDNLDHQSSETLEFLYKIFNIV